MSSMNAVKAPRTGPYTFDITEMAFLRERGMKTVRKIVPKRLKIAF